MNPIEPNLTNLHSIQEMFDPKYQIFPNDSYQIKTYTDGEIIYQGAKNIDKLYFLFEGSVKIYKDTDLGKEIIKDIIHAGSVFGEGVLSGIHDKEEIAVATSEVTLAAVQVDEFRKLMRMNSKLQSWFMDAMLRRATTIENRLGSLLFKDSRSRIIDYLVDEIKNRGEKVGYELVLRRPHTHQEVADITNTSRQTVTTVLNELRDQGMIDFNRRRLLVRDFDRLEKESIQ